MRQLNLSEWALRHQSMVLYLMIVFMVGGVISFLKLGRAEDPDFTFKVMVVRTLWPGASAAQVEQQLTERIEKKLAETPWVDVLRTASKPGESLTIVILKDYTPKTEVPEAWRQVRKKLDDIRHTFRPAYRGPSPTTSSAMCRSRFSPSSHATTRLATAWAICVARQIVWRASCAG
jgi:multidrug efflux pump subunit AcrB